jgi:hypothetical protein
LHVNPRHNPVGESGNFDSLAYRTNLLWLLIKAISLELLVSQHGLQLSVVVENLWLTVKSIDANNVMFVSDLIEFREGDSSLQPFNLGSYKRLMFLDSLLRLLKRCWLSVDKILGDT